MSLKRNDMKLIIQAAEAFAKSELENDRTDHHWWHVQQVAKIARRLAEEENADIHICTIAALLHDIADVKLNPTKEIDMAKVKDLISSQALNKQDQQHILTIIQQCLIMAA